MAQVVAPGRPRTSWTRWPRWSVVLTGMACVVASGANLLLDQGLRVHRLEGTAPDGPVLVTVIQALTVACAGLIGAMMQFGNRAERHIGAAILIVGFVVIGGGYHHVAFGFVALGGFILAHASLLVRRFVGQRPAFWMRRTAYLMQAACMLAAPVVSWFVTVPWSLRSDDAPLAAILWFRLAADALCIAAAVSLAMDAFGLGGATGKARKVAKPVAAPVVDAKPELGPDVAA